MPPQIACLGGYMITLVAFLRCAFSNVSSNGCVNGCIITLVAFVWLFFTVGFQMCPQSAGIKGCICLIFLHCVFSNVSSKRLHKRMDNHTGCIWKHTVEKRLTSATSVSMHPIGHPIWEHIWKPTAEKNQTNAACAIMHALYFVFMFKDYGFTFSSKSFAACIAFERLLTCVSPHVVL